jgi:hypothetical protein
MGRQPGIVIMAIVLLAAVGTTAAGQDRIGIHFQVYGEPHEPDNPVYVNVLPVVYETAIGQIASLKVGTVVGLRIADGVSLGNVGASVGVPFYPFGMTPGLIGLFTGPIVTTSYNFHTGELVVSTAADIGYSFSIAGPVSLTLGGEVGVSTFFAGGETAFRPHYGPAVYLFFGETAEVE